MKNIMTDVQELTYRALKDFDNLMKKSVTEPYGQRKLTEKEQWLQYQSLTPEKMYEAIQDMDYKQFQNFNKWLYKMEQKEANNGI